jgi:hypothetical protein
MQISWARGFFRAWTVAALLWVLFIGWNQYAGARWSDSVQTNGDCWDRLAVWPDGRPFNEFDILGYEVDTPANAEINRKNRAWSADSIRARNQWRDETLQKLKACEARWSIIKRAELIIGDHITDLAFAFGVILLPPIILLAFGGIFGWIINGFRPVS